MNVSQLRQALDEAAKQADDQQRYFDEIVEENSGLEDALSRYKDDLEDARDELRAKDYKLQSLRDQLSGVGGGGALYLEELLGLAARKEEPSPLECLMTIERIYGDKCSVLDSARSSAKKMQQFAYGRVLLDLLLRLVTTYRDRLVDGGDNEARQVFGKNEYAAKESTTVMNSRDMRRQRTFEYDGRRVEMFRHLKIGVADDPTRTIRTHFYWDGDRKKIVIGYCGEHLPVSSH